MGYTDEEKERAEHQFDAYNKKIMRRKAAKCYAVLNQKQLREVPFDSLAGEEEEQMAVSDSYEGLGYGMRSAAKDLYAPICTDTNDGRKEKGSKKEDV